MTFDYLRRRLWYYATHWPGRNLRVKALRKLGFSIGNDVYIAPGLVMSVGVADSSIQLEIGDRVAFGPNVTLVLASYPNFSKLKKVLPRKPRRIVIGEDTWVGANVTILPNIVIGKCCVIGAGAVVSHDVPDYSVVAGVPAKLIKTINPKELID